MTRLEELVLSGSSLPLEDYPGLSRDQARQYLRHRLNNVAGIPLGDQVTHAGFLIGLNWDTSLLNMDCGRVDFATATSSDSAKKLAIYCLEEANKKGIQHLSVRFDSKDINLIEAFQSNGFEQIDSISTFTKRLDDEGILENPSNIRLSNEDDAEQVAEISRVAFTADRFHSDPMISKHLADNLHAEWGRNSVLGNAADVVVVSYENGKILSFVTCKTNKDLFELTDYKLGTIVLVATAPEAQGRGLGKATVLGALKWFANQNCDCVEVGTQSNNEIAKKLYQGLGFGLSASSTSLRLWIDKD